MAKILVVEPDTDILHIVDVLLTMKGFTVIKCANKKKAIDEVQSIQPDVILLDIQPLEHDGEICKALKSSLSPFKHIPLILFSTADKTKIDYPECEPIDFVSKPFDNNELIEKIKMSLTLYKGLT